MVWLDEYDLILDPPERGVMVEIDLRKTDVTHIDRVTGCFYDVERGVYVGIYDPKDANQKPLKDFVSFYPVDGIKFRKLPQAAGRQ